MIGYRTGRKHFEIAAFSNLEQGTSKAGNSNENTNTSQVLLSESLL